MQYTLCNQEIQFCVIFLLLCISKHNIINHFIFIFTFRASVQVSTHLPSSSMPDNKNLFKFEDPHHEAINVEWEITDFLTSGSLSCHPLIFSFAKDKWMLYVSRKTPRCMWLKISNITRNNEPSEKWKCKFGLKETGGDMLHFTKSFIPFTTSRGELLRLRNDQTFPNNITILCTLQYICDISEPSASRECAPLKLISK